MVISFLMGCQNSSVEKIHKESILETNSNAHKKQSKIAYTQFLQNLQAELKGFDTTQKKNRFHEFIDRDIPKYWIGTTWDFNGTTRIPQKGNIACGYFVTNVLTDFGIDLKRIYLAQQPSSIMIKELTHYSSIQRFTDIEKLKDYLQERSLKNEIFIVGLDFHTGFIIKNNNEFFFLHSNYINREGVVKEKIGVSKALISSNLFLIGSLTQSNKIQ